MRILSAMILGSALAAACATSSADQIIHYKLDPWHTQVRFTWQHVGFSSPGADFTDVTGTIDGNQDHPELSTVNVVIPVKSLDTYVPALNEHLIDSGDFFKTQKFPTITFKSTGMDHINKDARTFDLHGVLTVNGIAKDVVLHAHANKIGAHPFYNNAPAAGFDASTTLKRSDFGMSAYVPMVSDDLDVHITVEAIEASAYDKKMAEMAAKKK